MNAGSPEVPLASVLALNRSGFWGKGSPEGKSTFSAKVVRNGDITHDGKLCGFATRFLSPREANGACLLPGDVAITTSGDPGKAWLVDEPGLFASNFVRILRPNTDKVLPSFLRYALETEPVQEALRTSVAGATIQNLQKKFYDEARFGLPSLPEQRRIVGLLDTAVQSIVGARANAERNSENARALFESHLALVFARGSGRWDKMQLSTLLDRGWIVSHLDGNHGSNYPRKQEFVDEGVPYISAQCIDGDRVDMSRAKHLSPARASLLRKGIAKDNDVLFAHNATVGPVAILRTDEEKVILSTSLTYYRCHDHPFPSGPASSLLSRQFLQGGGRWTTPEA